MSLLHLHRRIYWSLFLWVILVSMAFAREDGQVGQSGSAEVVLGVVTRDLDNDRLAERGLSWGVMVQRVLAGAAGDEAGLRVGDVLLSLDAEPIYSSGRLDWLARRIERPSNLLVELDRDGERLRKRVRVGWVRPTIETDPATRLLLDQLLGTAATRGYIGVSLFPMTSGLAAQFGVPEGIGVFVTEVAHDSPAQEAGLIAGDVITRVGQTDISHLLDVYRALKDADPGDSVDIEVVRSKVSRVLPITIGHSGRDDTSRAGVSLLEMFLPRGWVEGRY